jgi:hypothetical protein
MDMTFTASVSRYADGHIGEIFLDNHKQGSAVGKLDGNTGEWKKGKDPFNRQVIADVADVMRGYQAFENSKPLYHIGRIADGFQPPPPESFSENWKPVVLMPTYDSETHETYMFTSQSKGGRDAVANLVHALSDVYDAHPQDIGKLPICELGVGSYVNSKGRQIFYPVFETMRFVPRPEEVRRIKPLPPAMPLAIEHKAPAETPPPDEADARAKSDDPDDEIPF